MSGWTSRLRSSRAARALALATALALLACAVLGWLDPARFYAAWLVSWLFFLGLALGGMAQVMIHEITGGEWGRVLRPPLEAAAATLPVVALLALPLAFGLPDLFEWARPTAVAHSDTLQAQRWYLSPAAFLVRNGAVLLVWSVLSIAFLRASRAGAPHARRIAVAGLLVYLFTVTLAAFDWVVSLVPGFYSTAIGVRLGAAQFLASLSFAVIFVVVRARRTHVPPARDLQDFGNLLLTYAMMWAYIAFTQYLIVWGEDLPAETSWFWPRATTSWRYLVIVIVALDFALPAIAMLFRAVKCNPRALAGVCALALAGHWLDMLWLVGPSLEPQGFAVHALDALAFVAMGGAWLLAVLALTPRSASRTQVGATRAAAHG